MLERALRDDLFPELRRLGFSGPERESIPDDDEPPYRPAQLVFHFRQVLPGAGRVALAVAVKSNARPTFDVFAGRVPEGGVRLLAPAELIPADRVTASMLLRNQGHLEAGAGQPYFKQPLWAYLSGSERGIRTAVLTAARLLPSLVAWLRTGTPTDHVRIIDHATARPQSEAGAG